MNQDLESNAAEPAETTLKVGDRVRCTQGTNAGTVGTIDTVFSTATGWGKLTPQQFPLVRVYVPEPGALAWQFSHWAHAFEALPPLPEPGDPADEVEDVPEIEEYVPEDNSGALSALTARAYFR